MLLFLDDDVLPLHPSLVEAHRDVHHEAEHDGIVVGPALVDRRNVDSVYRQRGRNWWVDHTSRLATEPALGITDVCTGNLSVSWRLFNKFGGFPNTPRKEDWFFGLRAEAAGVEIQAAPQAAVVQRDAGRVIGRHDNRGDGAADASILREFPRYRRYISPDLLPETGRLRTVAMLAARHPRLQAWFESLLYPITIRLPDRSALCRVSGKILGVSGYWAGAATAFGETANPLLTDTEAIDHLSHQPVIDLADSYTPPEVAAGKPVLITFHGQVVDTTSAYGQGLGTPIWKFRRYLVDRYTAEVAKLAP